MNHRQLKKQAKRYLNGKKVTGVSFHEEVRYPRNDGTVTIIEMIPNSLRFEREVWKMVRRINPFASHWDSPFIVQIIER